MKEKDNLLYATCNEKELLIKKRLFYSYETKIIFDLKCQRTEQ